MNDHDSAFTKLSIRYSDRSWPRQINEFFAYPISSVRNSSLKRQHRWNPRFDKAAVSSIEHCFACITYLLQVEKQHFSILDHPGGFFDFDLVWKITVDDRRLTLDATGQSFFRDRHRHVLRPGREVHFQRHFDLESKNN